MQIRLMFFATLALAVFGLRTCGGPTSVAEKPSPASCTMIMTGAISATVPCMAIGGNLATSSSNLSTVGITAIGPVQGVGSATITVQFTGSMSAQIYTDANTSQYAALVSGPIVPGSTPAMWVASPNPKQGTISVNVTSYSSSVNSSSTVAYFVHGTASANLPAAPNSNTKGTVTLTATF